MKIITTTVINTDCEQQWNFQGLNAIIITIITDTLHKCVELRVLNYYYSLHPPCRNMRINNVAVIWGLFFSYCLFHVRKQKKPPSSTPKKRTCLRRGTRIDYYDDDFANPWSTRGRRQTETFLTCSENSFEEYHAAVSAVCPSGGYVLRAA